MTTRQIRLSILGLALGLLAASGCGSEAERAPSPTLSTATTEEPFEKLSQYGLFVGDGSSQKPAAGVVPYDLNSPLFSDYAVKDRFIRIPAGARAVYHETDFDYPVGTVIAKTFSYPRDFRDPAQGTRRIETRILRHEPIGWAAYPYVWNTEQTEATLDVAGSTVGIRWIDLQGRRRNVDYMIPNVNQCKGCHVQGSDMLPIGPRARHLNRDFTYDGGSENQLDHWTRLGILEGAPPSAEAPKLAVWDDPRSGSLDDRARAWLEINCAHCHNPVGPAKSSGLDLLASQRNPVSFGIYKTPVAAGQGAGGFDYDIVPGRPDQSILTHRIASIHPGVMMPELGKRLVHEEGVALIREWIASLSPSDYPRRRGKR